MEKIIPICPLPKGPIEKDIYEKALWESKGLVCGIDEVGRGCFAGPVVAGAVILPIGAQFELLVDSKTLSKQQLIRAYDWIIQHCWYAVAWWSAGAIDQENILEATKKAMKRALMQVCASASKQPNLVLVDAVPLELAGLFSTAPQLAYFTKGESFSSSIAAASIVAKVTRDRMMKRLGDILPGYELGEHKGYGTAIHQRSIERLGATVIHRQSFLKNMVQKKEEKYEQQQTIC